jgi:ketosteroid isomerase-like protein
MGDPGERRTAKVSVLDIVNTYYDAWIKKRGDLREVPLAEDFTFTGPVASFEDAESYRAMAREAGQAVTSFTVREQFVNGNRVCSIVDWEMALPVAPMTSAEILDVRDGEIVSGELIYDAEELRKAMAAAGSES